MDDIERTASRRRAAPDVQAPKFVAPAPVAVLPERHPTGPPVEDLRFPGCRPIRLLRDGFEDFEDRLEFWDARAGTAWVLAETPGGMHEGTAWRLPHLAERIALVRGAPIVSLGSVGLVVQDGHGRPERAMQADATLYLHPRRAVLPEGSLIIGEHDLPDVVLEVDYSTDVRPGKLPLYEAWGFPELWVVVPPGAKRKRRRPEGVTIHRLQGGRYRSLPASIAFPDWTAEEIHTGLTERVPSARTDRVLERVGRTLGAREGTGPDDTPLLRSLGERTRAEELAASVRSVLQARGIQVSNPDSVTAAALAGVPRDALLAAAVSAVDEADFRRRLAAVWRRRMAARNES